MRKRKEKEHVESAVTLDIPESGERDGPVGTLARGLSVLDALAGAPQPLGLAEVAGLTGLEQSTTLRLLRALEESRFVIRSVESKKYCLSPKALRPLPLLHPLEQLRREIATPLRDLALRIDKTVLLALYVGHERMVIDIAQGNNTINAYYDTWLTGPLHGTAAGKAYLVSLDAKRRHALLGPEPLQRYTEATFADYAALETDLALSEKRGYVLAREESRPGIGALAANVRTWRGNAVGCVVATGHARDFNEAAVEKIGLEVKQAADLILVQAPSLLAAAQFCGN
ncbi:IclR family transcriptional regulator [Paraburkholderia sp. IW21]|uniref:IclR family transcriptional regulator n=1 Tax=Paraburkholderia sp. IW21 TaxID=3242488 RepID=UPI003521F399